MTYELKLKDANILDAMEGEMRLGIIFKGEEKAVVEYQWTNEYFNARFIGHAPSMPVPNHPTAFLRKPIEAINQLKTDQHKLPTDVFKDHRIQFDFT